MNQYDVVIVGGGIHGAGKLQAAAAGHSALLIERLGLASGTSNRSSKLIHAGLIESGQFALVRESLRLARRRRPCLGPHEHFVAGLPSARRRGQLILRRPT